MCDGRNYRYIDHNDSIDVANHIGVGNLHLNRTGTVVLAKDFGNFLMNMDWWVNDNSSNLVGLRNDHQDQHDGFFDLNEIYLDELRDPILNFGNDISTLSEDQNLSFIDEPFSQCNDDLTKIRKKNLNRLIIGQININSLRNKFDFLAKQNWYFFDLRNEGWFLIP